MSREPVDPRLLSLLDEVAERGAHRTLQRIGLDDEAALRDVAELRGLLESWRQVKRGALRQLGQALSWAILLTLLLALGLHPPVTPTN